VLYAVTIGRHDPYEALRHPGYSLLLTGAVLASLAAAAQSVAVGYELYHRTGSPLMLGLSGLAQFLPVLLFALPAGQAADRFSRKRLYQSAILVQGCCSATLAWLSFTQADPSWILAVLFGSGAARAFTIPARQSLVPLLVPREALPNAMAWNSSGWQLANIAGPAVGGLLLTFAPPWAVYLCAAGGAAGCAVAVSPIRPGVGAPRAPATLSGLFEGLSFVFATPLLLSAITLDLFAVLLGGVTALMPVFARDLLHAPPWGLGLLVSSPAAGALGMAFLMAHRPPLRRPGRAMMLAVAGYGLATTAFAFSTNLWLSAGLLALAGALDNISVVVRGTLMQMVTPDEMRGRVSAVNAVFVSSSNELGEFESGALASLVGPVAAAAAGGIAVIAVVAIMGVCAPSLWMLGPLSELRPRVVRASSGTQGPPSAPPP
jgi:MFS family permease